MVMFAANRTTGIAAHRLAGRLDHSGADWCGLSGREDALSDRRTAMVLPEPVTAIRPTLTPGDHACGARVNRRETTGSVVSPAVTAATSRSIAIRPVSPVTEQSLQAAGPRSMSTAQAAQECVPPAARAAQQATLGIVAIRDRRRFISWPVDRSTAATVLGTV